MPYNFIIKEEAHADALNAYLYYEEKQEGLGTRFLKELNTRYEQIVQNPQHYSYIFADKEKSLRDVKIKNFPYVVIYDFNDKEATIYAVLNCHKNKKGI